VSRTAAGAFALAAGLAGAGCEYEVTLRAQALVPVELQREFSTEAPGLLVLFGKAGTAPLGIHQLAVLCEPGDQPLEAGFFHQTHSCAEEGQVQFHLTRVAPAERGAVVCGVGQQPFGWPGGAGPPTQASLNEVVGRAVATVFAGQGGRGCRDGEEMVRVTLGRVP
jgi:hypothetical protein